ncbi:MAG: YggT family protein [Candidatus Thiosymbion ectosymbiont of Robbea hypermnestra]|nr:YggT family protein [Candidatus Thiosymbion ectosymbiont of Robbea hypermnestra]
MTSAYFTNPLAFLVQVLFGFFAGVVLLRFLLQWVRADFYNPISQFVVRVTTPVLRPLRRVIPGYAGLDPAALVLAWLVKAGELGILALLLSLPVNPLGALAWALPGLVDLTITLLIFGVLIRAILSWFNPGSYGGHPLADLLDSLTEPVMGPARRLLPPFGGLDLSPMLVMIGLILLKMLLLPPLNLLTGSPF